MTGKPENSCVFAGCWKKGTLRHGSAREIVLCDDHASMADFSDERLNRWMQVAGRIHAHFDLVNTLAKHEVRRFRVALHDEPEPILVRSANNGSVSLFTLRPFIDFWIAQRPFGLVTTNVSPDDLTMPGVVFPWLPTEFPGIFKAVEDGPFEEISEARLLLGREL